jgi:hypothetical protein
MPTTSKYLLVVILVGIATACGRVGFGSGSGYGNHEDKPLRPVEPLGFGERKLNAGLVDLPAGRWIKIHEQKPSDRVTFRRQPHAGSAFDNRRGRIILFGSDTHGKDWTNSPVFFDVSTLTWSRLYPDDDPNTYRVNSKGIPVAGVRGDHPWAMHTFGAVEYDPIGDTLIVSSYPAHLEPGRFTDALKGVWSQIRRHPTWKLDFATGRWHALGGRAEHFFAYATAYDSDRRVVVGYKKSGIFELDISSGNWKQVKHRGLLGWHNNAVYDSRQNAIIAFGSNEKSNDIVVYETQTKRHTKIRNQGERPPPDEHSPMAFHSALDQVVVLVDRIRPASTADSFYAQTETWLYDLDKNVWTQVKSATLPFGCGMNYNLEYDPLHDLLLLVTNAP